MALTRPQLDAIEQGRRGSKTLGPRYVQHRSPEPRRFYFHMPIELATIYQGDKFQGQPAENDFTIGCVDLGVLSRKGHPCKQ